jgi:hypothetical protein
MSPVEIYKEIYDCGLPPHSDITEEWFIEEVNIYVNKQLQEFCNFHKLPNSLIGKFNLREHDSE